MTVAEGVPTLRKIGRGVKRAFDRGSAPPKQLAGVGLRLSRVDDTATSIPSSVSSFSTDRLSSLLVAKKGKSNS
jgi:hypothetical protein